MGRGWMPRGCRRSGRGAGSGAAVSRAAHVAGRARSAALRSTLRSRPPQGGGGGLSATAPRVCRGLLRKFCRPLCAGSGGPREQRRWESGRRVRTPSSRSRPGSQAELPRRKVVQVWERSARPRCCEPRGFQTSPTTFPRFPSFLSGFSGS